MTDPNESDLDRFVAMVKREGKFVSQSRLHKSHAGWATVDFRVGAGVAGSSESIVTAVFRPDETLFGFMWCD